VSSLAVLAISSAIAVVPHGAHAQPPATPRRIGILTEGFTPSEAQAFRQGLREAGYAEGRDVVIEWRVTGGDHARVPELAADLVQSRVEVIVVTSTLITQLAKSSTSTIPIVMALVGDPVGSGLVANLAHPGGNVTGLSLMQVELGAKRLQLLKEANPQLTRVAVLWNPATPWHPKGIAALKAAARALPLKLSFVGARTPDEFRSAFAEIGRTHAQGLYVMDDAIFFTHRTTLLDLASNARLPTSYSDRQFVDEGGLMSYGPNTEDLCRRSAGYVAKILKGANLGDLPIEQPTKFELVVNLKTAKVLGLTVPESILLRADEVIR